MGFSAKAVDVDEGLQLALERVGFRPGDGAFEDRAPAAVIRVANNSYVPEETLRKARAAAGRPFPYATIDARGHIFDAFDKLPELDTAFFVPGQVESCVAILRNMLAAPLGSIGATELMIRYVDSIFQQELAAASAHSVSE